nr:phage integrase SAM-like domain-containing protein [uncultured Draconibacterium sp.]
MNWEDILLSELNYRFITDFEFYITTDHQRPMGNNAVMKHLERLLKMVSMPIRMEWLDKNPFASVIANWYYLKKH